MQTAKVDDSLLRDRARPPRSSSAPGHERAAIDAFTMRRSGPRTTFPLVLASVTVASFAMWLDAVPRYSPTAFYAGVGLACGLAVVLGNLIESLARRPGRRLLATILLPAAFGAVIGMAVQAIVLGEVGPWVHAALKDLGGAIDTTEPVSWIAGGILLGGVPALFVALFLLLAARALRRISGHDASEHFGVYFVGACGVVAAIAFDIVDGRVTAAPLLAVTIASFVTLATVLRVDVARIRLLRKVYAGEVADLEIVPKDRFANDPSLAPMVSRAVSGSVLVRTYSGASYRAVAAEPLALVSEHASTTLRPLAHRRRVTITLLIAIAGLLAISLTSPTMLAMLPAR